MPKVTMPMASWDEVMMGLEILMQQGMLFQAVHKEISDQVYSQEY